MYSTKSWAFCSFGPQCVNDHTRMITYLYNFYFILSGKICFILEAHFIFMPFVSWIIFVNLSMCYRLITTTQTFYKTTNTVINILYINKANTHEYNVLKRVYKGTIFVLEWKSSSDIMHTVRRNIGLKVYFLMVNYLSLYITPTLALNLLWIWLPDAPLSFRNLLIGQKNYAERVIFSAR